MFCVSCNSNIKIQKCINCNSSLCSECQNSKSSVFSHLNIRYCPVCDKIFNMRIDLSTNFYSKSFRFDLIGIDYNNRLYQIKLNNGKKGYIYFNSSTIWEETPPKCIKHDNCNITICDDSCYSFDNNFKHYEDNKPLIDKYAKYREKYNLLLEQEEEERKKALRDGIDYKIDFENIERMSFDI